MALDTVDFIGRVGDRTHLTRREIGTIPTKLIANLLGACGELPGHHRNRQGVMWERFVTDIGDNGIRNPIFVTVDYGADPVIAEGNHRRDAALALGLESVPVEISYFGHAELGGSVIDR